MQSPNNPKSASVPPKAEGVETQKNAETVSFHDAAIDVHHITLREGLIYDLRGERRIEVWEICDKEGLAIRIYRPDSDGKRSKLLFGLTPDACDALMSGLVAKRWEASSVGRGNAANPPLGNQEIKIMLALRAADKMAWVCDDWVKRNVIDARSALADARLDYGEPFKYSWSKLEAPSVEDGYNPMMPPRNPKQKEGGAPCRSRSLLTKDGSNAAPHVPSVAAAAEDVAGEEWEVVVETIAHYCGIRATYLGRYVLWGLTESQAKVIVDAHNSCVSRLQEQIAYWKSEWNVQTASRDALLARAEKAEEQIKMLERTAEFRDQEYLKAHGGSWGQCKFQSENATLLVRAEEAEAKLAKIKSEKS